MRFPIQHIRNLRSLARRAGLEAPAAFWTASDERLQQLYNGIGSDKFRFLIGISTELFSLFEAAALIHDFEWTELNDGTRDSWHGSNERFRRNNRRLASIHQPVWRWFRPQTRKLWYATGDALAGVVSDERIYSCVYKPAGTIKPGPEVLA